MRFASGGDDCRLLRVFPISTRLVVKIIRLVPACERTGTIAIGGKLPLRTFKGLGHNRQRSGRSRPQMGSSKTAVRSALADDGKWPARLTDLCYPVDGGTAPERFCRALENVAGILAGLDMVDRSA